MAQPTESPSAVSAMPSMATEDWFTTLRLELEVSSSSLNPTLPGLPSFFVSCPAASEAFCSADNAASIAGCFGDFGGISTSMASSASCLPSFGLGSFSAEAQHLRNCWIRITSPEPA
ncbi:acetoacetyl reductase, putative [Babesia ovata]|uniref:Acetoacetyl reductase, putative n=1 Tax=Babesia ovata TaxID=189622 RepID=A0A2H6KBK9_9APIC|nr:acetoacetyl reductase, putative [Babesia ovata]GBE60380.1 acetoacetyl reductase, putative [Babesia ovata]